MKGSRIRKGSDGFTLVEVLLASVILAILVIGLGMFFGHLIKQSDIMDDKTRALEYARQGIEEIRTADFDTIPDGDMPVEVIDKFTRHVIVSSPFPTLSNARMVQCMMTWTSAQGPDTLSLSTVF